MASWAVPLGSAINVHALSVQMEVPMCEAYVFKSCKTDALCVHMIRNGCILALNTMCVLPFEPIFCVSLQPMFCKKKSLLKKKNTHSFVQSPYHVTWKPWMYLFKEIAWTRKKMESSICVGLSKNILVFSQLREFIHQIKKVSFVRAQFISLIKGRKM